MAMRSRALVPLVLLALFLTRPPAPAPAADVAPEGDAAMTQDELGLLHGTFPKIERPVIAHPLPDLRLVRDLWLTPEGSKLIVHEWREEKGRDVDRVSVLDVASGKVLHVLTEAKDVLYERRQMHVAPDGKTVVLGESDRLEVFDLATGKLIKRHPAPRVPFIAWHAFAADGRRVVGVTEDGKTAIIWDLPAGEAKAVKLEFVPRGAQAVAYPLAGRGELLVAVLPARGDDEAKSLIALLNPASGKSTTIADFTGNFAPLPTPDGRRLLVLRQEDPERVVWTSVEAWDLATKKREAKHLLKPPMASIGQAVNAAGDVLFLHEYLAQPVVVWNLKTGKLAAVVAPKGGGCQRFAITPDGRRLVAVIGPWTEGTLAAEKLAVYDTSKMVGAQ